MANILIVFGSKSDEKVYEGIMKALDQYDDLTYEVRILSAHRTPEELEELLKVTGAKVIIAGAGLAAHLPGVVAAKKITPVIGVPVRSNYQGLDSLLSIMQMPPGVPVLSVGVDRSQVAGKMAAMMFKEYGEVRLFFDEKDKAVQKAIETLKEFNIPFVMNPTDESGHLNIRFVSLDQKADERDDIIIYVPIASPEEDTAEAALNLLENSTNGLWVGLNRGENAALAAIEIMNIMGHFATQLHAHRKKHKEKVLQDDKEARS